MQQRDLPLNELVGMSVCTSALMDEYGTHLERMYLPDKLLAIAHLAEVICFKAEHPTPRIKIQFDSKDYDLKRRAEFTKFLLAAETLTPTELVLLVKAIALYLDTPVPIL